MSLTKKILIAVLAPVAISLMTLNLFQNKFIFRSVKLDKDYVFQFDQPFEEHFIPTEDGEVIHALSFKAAGPSKGLVLYFHGNANNLQRWGRNAVDLTSLGYDVLMIDYRGYGKSTGTPSEAVLYTDAIVVWTWAKAKFSFSRTIIYGRSLGSAIASNLAIRVNPDLLILETPFDELRGTIPPAFQPLLSVFPLRSTFPNYDHLAQVTCKKIIFHGTRDSIVPLSSALRLKPLLQQEDEFIVIPEGTHRNLRSFAVYKEKLAEVLK